MPHVHFKREGDFYEAEGADGEIVALHCNVVLTPARDGRRLAGVSVFNIHDVKRTLERNGCTVTLEEKQTD